MPTVLARLVDAVERLRDLVVYYPISMARLPAWLATPSATVPVLEQRRCAARRRSPRLHRPGAEPGGTQAVGGVADGRTRAGGRRRADAGHRGEGCHHLTDLSLLGCPGRWPSISLCAARGVARCPGFIRAADPTTSTIFFIFSMMFNDRSK
jgi:hypothetical protein